jgi:phosphatidate cytidylyltransferase
MLRERVAIVMFLLPPLIWVVASGGWLFTVTIGAALGLAAAEFGLIFKRRGRRPALPLMAGGVLLLSIFRFQYDFDHAPTLLAFLCLASMLWHLVDYERGAEGSGTDFAVTIAGLMYLGWIGPYLISLRGLPEGLWWILVVLPAVWLADSAAYFVGKAIGRHRLAPRLSPKKSWEGYLAGIVVGAAAGAGMAQLWRLGAGPDSAVTAIRGLTVGAILGALATLGDLGVSMIKREMLVKDSGSLIPGHGGVLDRVDSWLWAGVLGYYVVYALAR